MFGLAFADQCCDAVNYLQLGAACAKNLADCWDDLRPAGAILYFSLPFRLSLPPETIIFLNLSLLLFSIALAYYTAQQLDPVERQNRWWRLAAIVAPHVAFLSGLAWYSLSDVPATVFAFAAVQFMLLARVKDRLLCHLAVGLFLGLAVSMRAFFLYPALLVVASLLLLSVGDWRRFLRTCAALVILIPIALQYWATYARTSTFGFIDPKTEAWGRNLHFRATAAGYDTLIPASPNSRDAKECFHNSRNVQDALERRDTSALSCILLRRQAFYFGTYVPWGKAYLGSPQERHTSTGYLISNCLVLGAALARLLARKRRPDSLAVGLFVVAVWGQSLLIIPEARFLSLVLVWMWCEVLTAVVSREGQDTVRRWWTRWRARHAQIADAAEK